MFLKSKSVQHWARCLHVYISMALLFVVLFFSLTGITLNRTELFERSEPMRTQRTLQVPAKLLANETSPYQPDADALYLFLEQQTSLRGTPSPLDIYTEIEDKALLVGEITFDYKSPGYNATVFIDMVTQHAEIEITDYGVIALLNDLHKGRNSGEVWKWFIDITALLMVFFVLTGVCLLLPKKKTLRTALKWTAFGSLLCLLIYFTAVP